MRRRFAFLSVLALAGAGLGLAIAPRDLPDTLVSAEVAGMKLAYSRAYARDPTTAAGGPAQRLGFAVSFPSFAPLAPGALDVSQSVTLTVTRKDEGLDPAERPEKLYARFLSPETVVGPGGLVLRPFEPESPYDGEDLFLAPPDGRGFFARCPKAENGIAEDRCLSVFRIGAVDVELRYSASLLEHWEAVYENAQALILRMQSEAKRLQTNVTLPRGRNPK